jgi:hypothetical protein
VDAVPFERDLGGEGTLLGRVDFAHRGLLGSGRVGPEAGRLSDHQKVAIM